MKKLYLYKVFSENYTCPGLTKRAICLKYKRGAHGSPFHFLDFSRDKVMPSPMKKILINRMKNHKDLFIANFVSDGTIKMFAYLLLLNDPYPHPLLCIEEPENQQSKIHPNTISPCLYIKNVYL
jgi:hypothetical protein